jgi:hypothetical protein
MFSKRHFPIHAALVLAICFAPLAISAPAIPSTGDHPKIAAPVGVVLATQGAQVSQISAEIGSSLYPGDTLTTDAAGSLHVRFGASQLALGPGTVVKLAEATNGVAAVLQHGLIRFSAAGSPFELRVFGVIVRPRDGAAGELVIVGPSEFQIASTKGEIAVNIDGTERIVAESTAYDVTLESSRNAADDKRIFKRKGLWIPIAIIAALTAVNLATITLSSSKF